MLPGMNQETSSSEDHTSTKMTREFLTTLKLDDEEKEWENHESKEEFREEAVEEEEDDDDTEEEFSFSLAFDGANSSQITAEDAFSNGQIKPIFPLFNQDILLQEGVVKENSIANDRLPNVKKVFVEAGSLPATTSTSTSVNYGDAAGTYCYWEKKELEAAPEVCKKSNSTGFSKIWRFRDLMHRSSSDGRDTFVFLNNTTSSGVTMSSGKKTDRAARKAEKKKAVAESTVNGDEGKVKVAGEKGKAKAKAKKVVKGKTAASAHEVYLRSKAREQDRRRTYRPEVVGFFTNITGGGLTKNVHPF